MDTLLCLKNLSSCYKAVGNNDKWIETESKVQGIERFLAEGDLGHDAVGADQWAETFKAMGLEAELKEFEKAREDLLAKAKEKQSQQQKQQEPSKPGRKPKQPNDSTQGKRIVVK